MPHDMSSSARRRRAAPASPPAFADRAEAGTLLGAKVRTSLRDLQPVVLAIPRGGVAVGAGVARALEVRLELLVVRKIGHPRAPELGLGAIAELPAVGEQAGRGEPVFDDETLAQVGLTAADLGAVVARERDELVRRAATYRAGRSGGEPDLAGRLAVVVDDGLATGVTARAALRAASALGAARTMLAVPVASPAAVEALDTETGEVVTLVTPRRFHCVGEWYADFGQLTDSDVLTILASSGKWLPGTPECSAPT
jgi:putative phosphoribosyl transferase